MHLRTDSSRVLVTVIAVLCLAGAACGGERASVAPAGGPVHTDSAGVDVVTNPVEAGAVRPFAVLDPTPSLRVGGLDAPSEAQFGRVVDIAPLPDGGVAVLDAQAAEIRLFDEEGVYRGTIGSRGDGPGELRGPSVLGPAHGDSIAVFDRRTMRITRFALDGGTGVTTVIGGQRPILQAAFLPDGRMVARLPWTGDPDGGARTPPEGRYTFVADSGLVSVYVPEEDELDSLVVLPSSEAIWRVERSGASLMLFRRPAVFGRTLVFQAHPDGVWAGFNDRFELRLHDPDDGGVLRVVRAPGLERAATEDAAEAIYDHALEQGEGTPGELSSLREWFDLSPRPERMPAYDRIVVDDRARLWVRQWSGTGPGRRWWIFSRNGELLGSADVPEGVTLYHVRCDVAWGVLTDDLGVDQVVRYEVSGAAAAGSTC